MSADRYSDILVACPMPGQEAVQPERIGDFLQTEIGQRVLGPALANVEILLENGMSEDQALSIALGPALVRDEEGQFMRQPDAEQLVLADQLAESKKK